MSIREIKKDSADQSVVIRIIDDSDGTPENGVEYNTAGIDLWYRREGSLKVDITEVALGALDSAHSDGGIELIGDGYYRLDLPDAAVATGADGVMVGGTVTGMIVVGCYIPLVDYTSVAEIADGVWDEVITKATHNVGQSAAKRLRQVENILIFHEGTAQGPGPANNTIELAAAAHATDNWYAEDWCILTEGTGAGQMRHIDAYNGTTKVLIVGHDWHINPDNTTDYIIVARSSVHVHRLEADGLAQIGDAVSDEVIEGAVTLRQAIRLLLSVLTGKSSGGGTTAITFRDIGDTKDRLVVTADSAGNRTDVSTRDGS